MEFVDREITCLDCSQPFVFTAGEQEFYEKKGFREEPKRCRPCRDSRKARRNDKLTEGVRSSDNGGERPYRGGNGRDHGHRAADDSIGNRRFDGPPARGSRGPRGGGGPPQRRGGERELFDAVCAQCGVSTRVPFRPVSGRPVYCRECFGGRRGIGA